MAERYNNMRDILAQIREGYSPKEVKMAIGVASDPRYKGGNYTGAVNAIEKIKKGLSKHPQVAAVLKRQNEALDPSDTGGDEEVSMAMRQVAAIRHFVDGIEMRVKQEGDMEEWYQNKLTKAHDYLKTIYAYGQGDVAESLEEAVLSGRDYKVKDGKVHISKANFKKVSKDYKNDTRGKERMVVLDPKTQATVSMPVVFEEVDFEEGAFNKLNLAAKDLAKYAAKDKNGLDYKDFMKAAAMMKTGKVKELVKFVDNLDTEPRDAIIMQVKDALGKDAAEKMFQVNIRAEFDLDEMKMDDPKLVKAFDKLKRGDTIKLKTSSTISKGTDFVDYVVKAKNVVNKGKVEKVTLVTKGNEKAVKKFLYKRDGKVTFAIGDMGASIDDIKEETLRELEEGKSSTGYELYHKDFSSAMKHAYDFAKKKFGIEVDPKEIDDKVASGPRKPSKGKTNSYRLMGKDGKKAIQVQVYGMDNGKYELNMYKESMDLEESFDLDEMKMDDPKLVKAFDKLKRGDTIKLKTSSTISKGTDFVDYVVKAKNTVNKGRVEKVTLATKGNEGAVKKFLYKRDGKVTFAIGDMGASIDDIKEGVEPIQWPSQPLEEKLKVSDGLGAWIDDFKKSDAPQFQGKSDEEKKNMAIAAFTDAGGKLNEEEEPKEPEKSDGAKAVDQMRDDKKKTRIAQLQLQIAKAQETINKINAQEKPSE